MKCAITGIETKSMYKGIPLCIEMRKKAQEMVKNEDSPCLRSAIRFLARQWRQEMEKLAKEAQKNTEAMNNENA